MVWWRLRQYFLRLSFILANSKLEGFRIGSINITPKVALRTSQALALYTVADEPGGDRTVGNGQGNVEEVGGGAAMGSGSLGLRIKIILTDSGKLRSFNLIKNSLCLILSTTTSRTICNFLRLSKYKKVCSLIWSKYSHSLSIVAALRLKASRYFHLYHDPTILGNNLLGMHQITQ